MNGSRPVEKKAVRKGESLKKRDGTNVLSTQPTPKTEVHGRRVTKGTVKVWMKKEKKKRKDQTQQERGDNGAKYSVGCQDVCYK
jgi:hypothetical protein